MLWGDDRYSRLNEYQHFVILTTDAIHSLFDFFFPIPSLSTVSSVHMTLCLLAGAPLNFNTPTVFALFTSR